MSGEDSPPRSASLPPGYDDEDPYEGEDLDQYPTWWLANVLEFREHGLRPYRPSRFTDGAAVPAVLEPLERAHDVTVRIRSIDPHKGSDWRIEVDGTAVVTASRYRHADGYSVYDVTSESVEKAVEDFVLENPE